MTYNLRGLAHETTLLNSSFGRKNGPYISYITLRSCTNVIPVSRFRNTAPIKDLGLAAEEVSISQYATNPLCYLQLKDQFPGLETISRIHLVQINRSTNEEAQ